MKPLRIEICGNNELSWEEEWLEKVRELCCRYGFVPEILTDDCHDLCTECVRYPYLIIDRHVLMAETMEQLYDKLDAFLQKQRPSAGGEDH